MSSSFHSKGATYSRGAIGFFFLLIEQAKGRRTLNKGEQSAFLTEETERFQFVPLSNANFHHKSSNQIGKEIRNVMSGYH